MSIEVLSPKLIKHPGWPKRCIFPTSLIFLEDISLKKLLQFKLPGEKLTPRWFNYPQRIHNWLTAKRINPFIPHQLVWTEDEKWNILKTNQESPVAIWKKAPFEMQPLSALTLATTICSTFPERESWKWLLRFYRLFQIPETDNFSSSSCNRAH